MALGVVAHKMFERYWRGDFRDVPGDQLHDRLRHAWDELVVVEQGALDDAFPHGTPPRGVDWPGYAVTKSRTLRTLERVAGARVLPERQRQVSPEIELVDDDSGLYGKLDRLEVAGAEVTIVDVKAGLWQDEIKDSQRRQLLLYAWLVHATRGVWPTTIAIENAAGQKSMLPVDVDEVTQAAAQAQSLVELYNHLAQRGWEAVEASAQPSESSCKWCPARVECNPYWMSLTTAWGHTGAVSGRVQRADEIAGGWTVVISTESPRDREGELTVVYPLAGIRPGPDRTMRLINADARRTGALKCRWDTQGRWEGQDGTEARL